MKIWKWKSVYLMDGCANKDGMSPDNKCLVYSQLTFMQTSRYIQPAYSAKPSKRKLQNSNLFFLECWWFEVWFHFKMADDVWLVWLKKRLGKSKRRLARKHMPNLDCASYPSKSTAKRRRKKHKIDLKTWATNAPVQVTSCRWWRRSLLFLKTANILLYLPAC